MNPTTVLSPACGKIAEKLLIIRAFLEAPQLACQQFKQRNILQSWFHILTCVACKIEIPEEIAQALPELMLWPEEDSLWKLPYYLGNGFSQVLAEEDKREMAVLLHKAAYRFWKSVIENDWQVPPQQILSWSEISSIGEDILLSSFIQKYRNGFAEANYSYAMAAADTYRPGEIYQDVNFSILESPSSTRVLSLLISFWWTETKLWGRLDISTEPKHTDSQKARLLSQISIDICAKNSDRCFAATKIDKYGMFFIADRKEEIDTLRKLLNERELTCLLKIV